MTVSPSRDARGPVEGLPGSGTHAWTARGALAELGSDASSGLPPGEAGERLRTVGPNRLVEPRRVTFWGILRDEIVEPMIVLLLAIAVLYSLWGKLEDTVVIVVVIVTVVLVEVFTEYRAKAAIAALRTLSAPTAPVLRDARVTDVAAEEIVPGDIVLLRPGARLPADVRLVASGALRVDESVLTGESAPVDKDADAVLEPQTPLAERANLAFAGTVVVGGIGRGVVVATGMGTELGRIAGMVQEAREPRTPLQQAMRDLARWLAGLAAAFSVLIPVIGVLGGQPLREMILTGLTLAFATIPEELPIIITMVLALGAYRLSGRRALVKRLRAAETLGEVSVIAADKTGTLTQNRMAVAALWTGERRPLEPELPAHDRRLLELASVCHDATVIHQNGTTQISGDPLEVALLEAAREHDIPLDHGHAVGVRVREYAFDAGRQMMSVARDARGGGLALAAKGAPEPVLARSSSLAVDGRVEAMSDEHRARIRAATDAMAADGMRVIAFATRRLPAPLPPSRDEVERELTFVGLVGLADPPRPEVPAAVAAVRSAGIRVLMVTGDHPATARAVARAVGLDGDGPLLTGPQLEQLDATALREAVANTTLFARVTPEDKLRLVRALHERGERVAVTGDGINDAPALREADIGVAMGETGTDVAKEAADLVLADDNFATIARAVGEGRQLFDNLRKGVAYYLACKVALIASSAAGVVLGLAVPFAPIQIVVMEAFMDVAASAAFVAEPPEADVMSRPRDPRRSFMDRSLRTVILTGGLTLFVAVAGVYVAAKGSGTPTVEAQTLAFTSWMVGYLALAWVMRSERTPLSRHGLLSNPFMLIWTAATIGALAAFIAVPAVRTALRLASLSAFELALAAVVPLVAVSLLYAARRHAWTATQSPATPPRAPR